MLLILIQLIGGLGLFLYGMNLMSSGVERLAGSKLRDILKTFTKNKFLGLVVGLFFTALIQSSSAATVMVVGFVNAGLMTLVEASGVVMGANIGTTVTSLLVAFKLSTIAPIFVFAGAIMVNFFKKAVVRRSGYIVLGFGLLFLGITFMSDAMASLREIPEVINALASFTNPFLGVLVGLLITSIVQSSSVTVSILVVMASQGLVDLNICLFFILGCNIGACTSAVLSAVGGSKMAKRAALIHLLFNIISTIILFVALVVIPEPIANGIKAVAGTGTDSGTLGRQIAMAHFLFKVVSVIVLYPFMNLVIKLTYVLVPGEEAENDGEFNTKFITENNVPNPSIAIYLSVQEMFRMANMAKGNLNLVMDCLYTGDVDKAKPVADMEKYLDYLNIQIGNYLVKINESSLPVADANRVKGYFHVITDLERIGDYADKFRETLNQCNENNITFSSEALDGLRRVMEFVNKIFDESVEMLGERSENYIDEITALEKELIELDKELQSDHLDRVNHGLCTVEAGIFYSDILTGLERIAGHSVNIAHSLDTVHKEMKKEPHERKKIAESIRLK